MNRNISLFIYKLEKVKLDKPNFEKMFILFIWFKFKRLKVIFFGNILINPSGEKDGYGCWKMYMKRNGMTTVIKTGAFDHAFAGFSKIQLHRLRNRNQPGQDFQPQRIIFRQMFFYVIVPLFLNQA